MLREIVTTWRVRATRAARLLGLAREHAAIAARHARVGAHWQPHLEFSRQAILAAASRCARHRSALIVGAGSCLDLPLAEIVSRFEQVWLADVVISPAAARWARQHRGRIQTLLWDTTGALDAVAARRSSLTASEAEHLFRTSRPSLPPRLEPDLVVSANCLSQLGLVPADALPAAQGDDGLPDRCARAAASAHLDWLRSSRGVAVLLADIARLDVSPDGRVLHRHELLDGLGLGAPDQTWRWELAPIPEWDRSFHRFHEIGAWLDLPCSAGHAGRP